LATSQLDTAPPAYEYGEKSFEKDQQAIDRYREMVEK